MTRSELVFASWLVVVGCDGRRSDEGTDAGEDGGAGPAPLLIDELPAAFPRPVIPEDEPVTRVRVDLGRRLFYDVRLSGNQTQSCASCHVQANAFTDGRTVGLGSTGESHVRNAQSLVNVAFRPSLTWANPVVTSLSEQALIPLFGETPIELGLSGQEDALLARLRAEPIYVALFAEAFPGETEPVSLGSIVVALAAFERTILSFRSPYDRYVYAGDRNALSASAKRGLSLFFDERLE